MELNPLALLEKLINEHGSSAILKERLELLRDQMAALQGENAKLKTDLAAARAEVARHASLVPNARFVEYRGAKFKRKPSGGFEPSVYCPSCEVGMATIPRAGMPFACGKCNALSGFTSSELASVLAEVHAEFLPPTQGGK